MYVYELTILCMVLVLCQSQTPEVQTSYGKVQGYTTSFDSTSYTKFLGIPFAKPPVENLRFQKPVKPDSWNGVLKAENYSASCYQLKSQSGKFMESEDCLYINIFVPGKFEVTKNNPKAVMFWIYGGGYSVGNANTYPGESLANSQDVIVVTFNYRVGLFGFAYTDGGGLPGNMGLFDQVAALQWVNDNIASFGGDASRITIFGQSAGADSVVLHLMSPLSKDLFQRAIIQSPPSLSVIPKKNQHMSLLKIVEKVCSSITGGNQLWECLQYQTAATIVEFTNAAEAQFYQYVTVDGEFVTSDPYEQLLNGTFNTSKPIIIGFTASDGDLLAKASVKWEDFITKGTSVKQAKQLASTSIMFHFRSKIPNQMIMENLLYQKYISCMKNPLHIAESAIDMLTDASFTGKTFQVASAFSKYGGKVYLYEFDHLTSYLRANLKPNIKLSTGHGREVIYVFGYVPWMKLQGTAISAEEILLGNSVMKAFSEFAKNGQPMYLTNSNKQMQWKEYTNLKMEYLKFTTNMTQTSFQPVSKNLQSRVHFWNSVLPGIHHIETCDTYMGGDGMKPHTNKGASPVRMSLLEMMIMTVTMLVTASVVRNK